MMWKIFKNAILLYVLSLPIVWGLFFSAVMVLTLMIKPNWVCFTEILIVYCFTLTILELCVLSSSRIKELHDKGEL